MRSPHKSKINLAVNLLLILILSAIVTIHSLESRLKDFALDVHANM